MTKRYTVRIDRCDHENPDVLQSEHDSLLCAMVEGVRAAKEFDDTWDSNGYEITGKSEYTGMLNEGCDVYIKDGESDLMWFLDEDYAWEEM